MTSKPQERQPVQWQVCQCQQCVDLRSWFAALKKEPEGTTSIGYVDPTKTDEDAEPAT